MRIDYDDEVVYDVDQEVKIVDMLKVLGLENPMEHGFRLMIPPMTLSKAMSCSRFVPHITESPCAHFKS